MPARMVLITKIFNFLIMLTFFVSDAIYLGLNYQYIVLAFLGSLSGAFVLGYFQPSQNFWERMTKMIASGIAGLFVGAFLNRYLDLQHIEYVGMAFFLSSFLSLIMLKAALTLMETNAQNVLVVTFQRVFNIQPKQVEVKPDALLPVKIVRRHRRKKPVIKNPDLITDKPEINE